MIKKVGVASRLAQSISPHETWIDRQVASSVVDGAFEGALRLPYCRVLFCFLLRGGGAVSGLVFTPSYPGYHIILYFSFTLLFFPSTSE
jgi:hypothetical protein